MKKICMLLTAAVMVFTSCTKYDASEALDLETLPKVTVTGTVFAPLDSITPALEPVPAGTVITVVIPYTQYDASGAVGNYTQSAATDANGNYSIEVPVVSKGVTATIKFADFTATVKKNNGSGAVEQVLTHFSLADITGVSLGAGKNSHVKINATYTVNATNPNDVKLVPTHNVKLTANFDYVKNDAADKTSIPETSIFAKIVLSIAGETRNYTIVKEVTSQSGKIDLDVPMVKGGNAVVTFTAEGFWSYTAAGTAKTYRFYLPSATSATVYNHDHVVTTEYSFTRGAVVN